MEVSSGVVLESSRAISRAFSPSLSHVCYRRRNNRGPNLRKYLIMEFGNLGFEDKGHLQYYRTVSPVCGEGKKGWNGVSSKKKMKLLKGLVKDLSTFSDLGFGLDFDCGDNQGFVDEDKSKIVSQAAEVLLSQLKQLRAEEELMKKKKKEEKEKSKTQDCESSSSSSESSDGECGEVVDMKSLKNTAVLQPVETKEMHLGNQESSSAALRSLASEGSMSVQENCCNMILETTLNKDAGVEVLRSETPKLNQWKEGSACSLVAATPQGKRVEVCMGGKCKKSGAPALMEEFQRVMVDEGVVVGCKCMGKCKSAPNVRVLNGENVNVDDSLRTPGNPLFIGVALEDVGSIVANYFGDELTGFGLAGVTGVPT